VQLDEGPLDILDPAESWSGIEALAGDRKPDFAIHCGDQVYPTCSPVRCPGS
jgi:hypothetical protein